MKPDTLLALLKYLPLIRKLSLVLTAIFPLALMSLAIFGYLNPDFATASISVTFTVALIPGVLQCRREKRGWSQFSCDQTGFGLIGMAGVFYYVTFAYGAPLFITATTTLTCGIVWMILLAQAFKYAKSADLLGMISEPGTGKSLASRALSPETLTDALNNPDVMDTLQGLMKQFGIAQKDTEEEE